MLLNNILGIEETVPRLSQNILELKIIFRQSIDKIVVYIEQVKEAVVPDEW
jgi:hypothetical protein